MGRTLRFPKYCISLSLLYKRDNGPVSEDSLELHERIYVTPQSSDAVVITERKEAEELLAPVVCDDSGTTCFTESASVKHNPHSSSFPFTDYMVRDDKLADFFAKPVLIGAVTWATSAVANTNLLDFSVKGLLSGVPYADKLKGFGMFRAKFHVRIELNANPFQQGLLLLHYIPNQVERVAGDPGFLSRTNGSIQAKVQHPSCYIFASDKSIEFDIPYISPSLYYDVVNNTYDWGNVKLDVMLPLATGVGGPTDVELTAFGYFSECEFVAPIAPQSSSRVTVRKNEAVESEKPVSSGLLSVSKAATDLANIPFLSSIAAPAAFVARHLAELTSYFGFSKPRLDSQLMFMTSQPGRLMNTSTGGDQSHPLGIVSDMGVDTLTTHSLTGMDEMSLAFLAKVPHYYGSVDWTTSQAPDTTLVWEVLHPSILGIASSVSGGGKTMNYKQGGPIWYLSNFFRHWRGSMRMNVKIAKTVYHTGKIVVAYQPGDKPVQPSNATSVFCLRNIIDISEQDEFTIEFPYLVWRTWLETGINLVGGNRCMGGLRISVLNRLRCPQTASSTVKLFITFTFGDDFMFNAPCSTFDPFSGANNYVQPIVVSPQSGSVVFSQPIAKSEDSKPNFNPNSTASGDYFSSIKQLYNRMTTVRLGGDVDMKGTMYWNPFFPGGARFNATTGALANSFEFGDAYSLFSPMYLFHRGSMRVDLGDYADGVAPWMTAASMAARGINIGGLSASTSVVFFDATSSLAVTNVANCYNTVLPTVGYEPISHNETGYLRCPPYSQFPASIIPLDDDNSRVVPDRSTPQAFVTATIKERIAGTGLPAHIGRGPAEDWVSTFFFCAPPLLVSYV